MHRRTTCTFSHPLPSSSGDAVCSEKPKAPAAIPAAHRLKWVKAPSSDATIASSVLTTKENISPIVAGLAKDVVSQVSSKSVVV